MKPGLSHQSEKSHSFKRNRFTTGIWTCDDQKMKFFSKMNINGYYFLFIDEWMASFTDVDVTFGVENRTGGILFHCQRSTGKDKIQFYKIFQIVLDGFSILSCQFT